MGIEISCKTFKRFNNAAEHYSVPDGIICIDDLAFADSERLVSLTIPESVGNTKVTGISSKCFDNETLRNHMTKVGHFFL